MESRDVEKCGSWRNDIDHVAAGHLSDAQTMRIVCTWPGTLDVSRALGLGFGADRNVDSTVRQFMAERAR